MYVPHTFAHCGDPQVCQIAKIKGCTVYAIAGGDDKCKWLESELGVDKAINYKAKDFAEQVKKLGYFDCVCELP